MDQKYKAPPITEAVIEVLYETSISSRLVEKAQKRLSNNYSAFDPHNQVKVQIDLNFKSSQFEQEDEGFKLSTDDRADVLIISNKRFMISRLAPYPGWDAIEKRAKRDWAIWRKVVDFHRIARVGVRYINRIDIPFDSEPNIKLEDYLHVFPKVPEAAIPPLARYGMQILAPLEDSRCSLTLNSGSTESPLINHAAFLLDIDIGCENEVPQKDDELWALIKKIRTYKNSIFEACITDKTRKLFLS